ncbi:Ankyrin repeats (many copies) [Phytophthora infestans]|uniref:Ankyrin repeats (Many copies) n=1 Tax=Phytophthora infestans TaxID=4787 RepID=A0A8S9UIT9_PHYIN|nr:Ankyrin repeats (many copies) [Phytophthora infestans]
MKTEDTFVLTGVLAVCREWPEVGALPHVVQLTHEYSAKLSLLALPNLLNEGKFNQFYRALSAVEQSSQLVHHEKLRQFRLAMHLIPSKMTMQEGALKTMKELYARYHGCIDSDTIGAICEMANLRVLKWLYACEPKLLFKFDWSDKQIFLHASMKGHADVVRWLVKLFPESTRSLEYAAKGGHLDLIKWLMKHTTWDETSLRFALADAVEEGYLDTAKFLHNEKPATHVVAPWGLGFQGNFEMTKWLHQIGCNFDNRFGSGAVSGGHLEIVQWLHINHLRSLTNRFHTEFHAMDTAADEGHLEILKFLHINLQGGCTTNAMDQASAKGHLKIVEWLHENRSEGCTTKAMDRAAAQGHLDIVQWLHVNRSEGCTTDAMDSAAFGSHLDVIEWLSSNRDEGCTQDAIRGTLDNCCLDIARWIMEHQKVQCSDQDVSTIVENGDLEMVMWLHNNGKGEWSKKTMNTAALRGHLNIVKFLHENRREGCSIAAMNGAATKGHLDVVKWLHVYRREGCSASAMNGAAAGGHLNVVKWLHAHRTEGCTVLAMVGSASNGHIKVMKFLAGNFSLNWPNIAIRRALDHEQIEAAKWLHFQLHQPLLKENAYQAARHGHIGVLEFIRSNAEHCITATIFHTGNGNHHPEVVKWYEDRYGNPRKRKYSTIC